MSTLLEGLKQFTGKGRVFQSSLNILIGAEINVNLQSYKASDCPTGKKCCSAGRMPRKTSVLQVFRLSAAIFLTRKENVGPVLRFRDNTPTPATL